MELAAPKMIFLDAYLILYNELINICSVKVNNQNGKITGLLASIVINLCSSYTGRYLVAEFR